MHLKPRSNRLRHQARPDAELLEGRELLTGGAGSNFALVQSSIPTVNGSAQVNFAVNPANFKLPKGSFSLGIDVAALTGSSVQPAIVSITGPDGKVVSQTIHSNLAVGSGAASAVIVPVAFAAGNQPANYKVTVTAQNDSKGSFLVGFYLPGDADGDGSVTKTDLKAIRSEMGASSSSNKYTFDADVNRDGRVSMVDYTLAQHNSGVSTTVTPVVTSTIAPAPNTDTINRVTNLNTATFTGTATPGASITYAETTPVASAVSTTADAAGKYSITVPLGPGANQFLVNVNDTFDQTIAGKISAVTLTTTPVTANSPAPTPTPTPSDPTVNLGTTKAQQRAAARAAKVAAHAAKVAALKASGVKPAAKHSSY
jgi:Dockerin type I domain